ncbi:PKD-like family lipoprotein [Chryseosolibacter indicus]|uniref:PKD-like family protein n=1 Tax=Chryseosolibacter indicus TaxID=2782351 RepID=A0ABS5VX39_9BACT|nr:PKD-like family lipoprotein [Chryseosolibacter indicus]MBT1705988.1 hypothetical protein [Chryseosolibacter indicus]
MKKNILYLLIIVLLSVTSCYEDLGNYDYKEVEDPTVIGLQDNIFVGYIGDSLIIEPKVTHSLAGTDALTFDWEIANHLELKGEFYKGSTLRFLFNLKPAIYSAKLTITNQTNGMKYFYNFKIEGRTEFSTGTAILSNDGGIARLSFVKAGNVLIPNLYEGLHGENLPNDPKQILIVDNYYTQSYHIVTGEINKPGVILEAATMLRTRYLKDNFFETPDPIVANSLKTHPAGAISHGVINGKLYCGTWQTFSGSPVYGLFGARAAGDYELSPWFNFYGAHYLGYDVNKKQLLQFDMNLGFTGLNYTVIPAMQESGKDSFDPKDMKVDLLYMQDLNPENSYAFGKDANGIIYEYKFDTEPTVFFPKRKVQFPGASLIRENTKWQGSQFDVIFFTSDDKIYRYVPDNQDLRPLEADFSGKTVTMIKLIDNDLLIAGVEGSIYYLDVSTGKYGSVYRVIDNIPGSPVDVVVRK